MLIFAAANWLPLLGAENAPSMRATPPGLITPEQFQTPPRDAGVHVWWHWMDGGITREGITKDLEVMKAQGVVQATLLNVGLFNGRDFGVPKVAFASEKWFEMYRWAVSEAARLGLTIGVHNCDGWSSSGGPWITPELSMKQYTWTKVLVRGGRRIEQSLAQPPAVEGFYRDFAVIAYRTSQGPSVFRASAAKLTVNDSPTAVDPLMDGSPISHVRIQKGDRLVFASPSPLEFSRVALHLRRPFMWGDPAEFTTHLVVETSDDGAHYREAAVLSTKGLNHNEVHEVPAASGKFVRLTVRDLGQGDPWSPIVLSEFELLRAGETPSYSPSIPHLGEKTSSVKGAPGSVDVVAENARAIAPKDVVVLTDRMTPDGRLRWDAPEGSWAIIRFGYTATGSKNAPATREGVGLECDKMDPAALDRHFEAFPARLITEAGEHAGRTLRFILVDSWEAGFQNWTDRLPAEFERRRGYSLVPWVPVLTGETISSTAESEAVLFDFRRTIADLIRENYYDRFAARLHERKIELHSEVIYGGPDYPPLDVLLATKNVDLPMMEFWTGANKDSLIEFTAHESTAMDLPISAAVGYGKPLVGSEAYTGYAHYSESPMELAPYGNRAFAAGVNRMILHSSVHQPTDEQPGLTLGEFASHFNRNNLYWPHARTWIEHQARIQSLLGLGTPAFDVLYFLGDQLPQTYVRNVSTTLPAGYTLTAINADLLNTHVRVVNGRVQLNGVVDAALLSLPAEATLSLESLRRVETLVREGAHVYGPKPQRPLSLADGRDLTEFRAIADRVWGADSAATISHPHGKGRVSWGRPLADVLAESRVPPQFAAVPAVKAEFLFTHRGVGDAEVFFVANQSDRAVDRECVFRVAAKAPEIWNPDNGDVTRPAAFVTEHGQIRVPARFEPRQALLFVFRGGLPADFVTAISRKGETLFPASHPGEAQVPQLLFRGPSATVETAASGSYALQTNGGKQIAVELKGVEPLTVANLTGSLELRGPGVSSDQTRIELKALRALTDFEAPEIRYFSGEATYRLRFSVPDLALQPGDRVRLDIGGFESVAEVTLNGHAVGQLWKPGLAIDVTEHLRRDNELSVAVVNTYRNRFIGDFAQFGAIKHLRTSSPITQFLSAEKPLKRSGLWGPITVTRVRQQTVAF